MSDNDPTAGGAWNDGCDFAMTQLCLFLGVNQNDVRWDAATETVDGDVQAVIGNILRAKFGEDWGPDDTFAPAQPSLPPIVDRAELIALLEDLASVNLSREACARQARRMSDDLIARGLGLASQPSPAATVDRRDGHIYGVLEMEEGRAHNGSSAATEGETKTVYVKRWRTLVKLPAKYADEIVAALRIPVEPQSSVWTPAEELMIWLDEQIDQSKKDQIEGFRTNNLVGERAHARHCALYEVKQKFSLSLSRPVLGGEK